MSKIIQEKKEEDLQQVFNKVSEIGIDEVGRGAVFGPVFSAVVVLNQKNKFILKKSGITDSKKATVKQVKKISKSKEEEVKVSIETNSNSENKSIKKISSS